jgi:hypothetical protein
VLSSPARFALAAIPIGLATVFIPDHSPRALALFLVAHSAFGGLLFAIRIGSRMPALHTFGYATGGFAGLIALLVVINDSSAAQFASITAIAWSLLWATHWLLLGRARPPQILLRRDLLIQIVGALALAILLALSFGDPIASTGFVGLYLVSSGLHLAIVAASPKVG